MLDYKQAHEIRARYPKELSRQDIDGILSIWLEKGTDRIDMLSFSCMYDMHDERRNLPELELYLRSQAKFTLRDWKKVLAGINHCSYFVWPIVDVITEYMNASEIEKETWDLRIAVAKDMLDELEESFQGIASKCAVERKAFKKKCQKEFEERWKIKRKRHPYQVKIDEFWEGFIKE